MALRDQPRFPSHMIGQSMGTYALPNVAGVDEQSDWKDRHRRVIAISVRSSC